MGTQLISILEKKKKKERKSVKFWVKEIKFKKIFFFFYICIFAFINELTH